MPYFNAVGAFNSVESLVDLFANSMLSWTDKIRELVPEVSLSAGSVNVDLLLGSGTRSSHSGKSTVDRLNNLLDTLAGRMPTTTYLRGTQLPIFVIDEANHLKALLRDQNGQSALESMFEWFVLHTKEKWHFHVVLLSSDSFFNLWVENFVGASRYDVYVVGHLERSEAEKYWNERVLKKYKEDCPPLTFEDVYEVCGGSMFLMDRFFQEYCEPFGLIHQTNKYFSSVLQEKRRYVIVSLQCVCVCLYSEHSKY